VGGRKKKNAKHGRGKESPKVKRKRIAGDSAKKGESLSETPMGRN